MIKNNARNEELAREWTGVRKVQQKVKINAAIGRSGFSMSISSSFVDLAYSLVLVMAYGALQHTLQEIYKENISLEKVPFSVSNLMNRTRKILPWQDFNMIREGNNLRNRVAHDGRLLSRGDSWKYTDAIEQELIAWGIIPDQNVDYQKPYGARDD